MLHVAQQQLDEFVTACHRVAGYGLLKCSSGNLSCRIDAEHVLITATRSWLADITTEQVALLRLSDGEVLNNVKPSVESRFHLGILRSRPDVNVVLHFQSPGATTLTCADPANTNFFVIPEIPYYIGPIAVVPYIDPGSADLAAAVVPAMHDHNLAILTHHGQVTVGRDHNEALQRAVFFELACDILVRGGDRVRPLTPAAVDELLAHSRAAGNTPRAV
jgi:ribulose-5-phosphate 4-epimerase/fuculose-1-phosphate aldolase